MFWIDPNQEYAAGTPVQRDFWCDTPEDIANLPTSSSPGIQQGEDTVSCQICAKGSTCFCISPVGLYILNSEDEWKEAKKGGT